MAYEKQTFENKTTILSAEHLEHIEDGIHQNSEDIKRLENEIWSATTVSPLFASSLDECTDTTMLYVLPDGYIYAYILSGKAYTNMLKESAVGYKNGYRLSSSGAESTQDWSYVTGYVPCKLGDVVRLQNIGFAQSGCDGIAASNLRISFYDTSKTHLAQTNAANFNQFFYAVYESDGYIDQFTVQAFNSNALETVAYFRLNATHIGDDSVVTINEAIAEGAAYKWTNTGHAFVPADYEDRIVAMEARHEETASNLENHGERLSVLESADDKGVPWYVQSSAEAVARTANTRQNESSLVFAFLADGHCGWGADATHEAVKQAAQAVKVINSRCPLDFVAHGGDLSVGGSYSTIDSTFTDIEDYTEIMSGVSSAVPSLWMPGNHDDAPYQATADRLTQAQTFALIGRKNQRCGAVFEGMCNYGYLDLESRKMRVIYLDTHDKREWGTVKVESGSVPFMDANNIGGEQLLWLANTALDFSAKDNPGEWAVVVLSHAALNCSGTITDAESGASRAYITTNAAIILAAYKSGGKGNITHNGVSVNYNFSGLTERAEICCAVHGHNHTYSNETVSGIVSIGCPNLMNGRERSSADGNTYTKVPGTEQGTSFCVITVDRKNKKVFADHYGAGYDREFNY